MFNKCFSIVYMPRCLETIHSTARQLICSPLPLLVLGHCTAHTASWEAFQPHSLCYHGEAHGDFKLTLSLASRHFFDKLHCSKSQYLFLSLPHIHFSFLAPLLPSLTLGCPNLFNELRKKTKTHKKLMSTGICFGLCKNPRVKKCQLPAELRVRVQFKDRTCK